MVQSTNYLFSLAEQEWFSSSS